MGNVLSDDNNSIKVFGVTKEHWGIYANLATILASAAAIVTLVYFGSTYHSDRAIEKQQELKAKVTEWQQAIVHDLICESASNGISFEDIRTRYVVAAEQGDRIQIAKSEISDLALKNVLYDLEWQSLISMKADGKYIKNYGIIDAPLTRTIAEQSMRYRLLKFLATDSGRYKLADLTRKVEVGDIDSANFESVANAMCACGELVLDGDGTVSSRVRWIANREPEKPSTK